MFHLAGQIFFGLIIGTLAKLVMGSKDPYGVIVTALIGLAGSIACTFMSHLIFGGRHVAGWVLSIAGAIVTLIIYHLIIGNRPRYRRDLYSSKEA